MDLAYNLAFAAHQMCILSLIAIISEPPFHPLTWRMGSESGAVVRIQDTAGAAPAYSHKLQSVG